MKQDYRRSKRGEMMDETMVEAMAPGADADQVALMPDPARLIDPALPVEITDAMETAGFSPKVTTLMRIIEDFARAKAEVRAKTERLAELERAAASPPDGTRNEGPSHGPNHGAETSVRHYHHRAEIMLFSRQLGDELSGVA
jgi:hypothetical protein